MSDELQPQQQKQSKKGKTHLDLDLYQRAM